MKRPRYSIVIPAFNEGQRLGPTLDRILAHVAKEQWDTEVIVVNDGSRDNTPDIVREYAKRNGNLRLVENPGNRGKGYSVRNGMLQATGEICLLSDADLSSPIYEASKLFNAIAMGSDIAIGSRWLNPRLQTERQAWYRQLNGRVFNLLLRLVLGLKQKDTQCGFKAFTQSAVQAVFRMQRIERWGFDPELLYIARRKHLRVSEVAVEWADDTRSKINPLRDGLKMVKDVFQIRWNGIRGRYKASAPPRHSAEEKATEMPTRLS